MGAFRTQDGFINIAPMPNHWPAFCKTTGLEALIDDPKYSSFDARVEHRAELIVEIEKATTQKSSDYWIEALNEARVPCGPIYAMDQVFADPQIVHSGIASKVRSPARGEIEVVGQPLHLTRTPNRRRRFSYAGARLRRTHSGHTSTLRIFGRRYCSAEKRQRGLELRA